MGLFNILRLIQYFMFSAEESLETLDYSNKYLKKIEKATENQARTIVTLILDENELQRLDAIDSYTRLENVRQFHAHN